MSVAPSMGSDKNKHQISKMSKNYHKMKKQIAILAAGLIIAASSCTKKSSSTGTATPSSPTTPTIPGVGSTLNFTWNGYTYNLVMTSDQSTVVNASTQQGSNYYYGVQTEQQYAKFSMSIGGKNKDVMFLLGGAKLTNDAVGTYRTGGTSGTKSDVLYGVSATITHYLEGGKQYGPSLSKCVDTNGVIEVTLSNSTECKGTFTTTTTDANGTTYPVTGNFHYKK